MVRERTKAQRRADRERVAAYHERELATLLEHVEAGFGRYRAGEIDAYDLDELIHQYHCATRELWKFCWGGGGGPGVSFTAGTLELWESGELEPPEGDWWDRGAPRRG